VDVHLGSSTYSGGSSTYSNPTYYKYEGSSSDCHHDSRVHNDSRRHNDNGGFKGLFPPYPK